nr:unnamed protein product [Spirometra erinaceieuropaei]
MDAGTDADAVPADTVAVMAATALVLVLVLAAAVAAAVVAAVVVAAVVVAVDAAADAALRPVVTAVEFRWAVVPVCTTAAEQVAVVAVNWYAYLIHISVVTRG